VNDEWETIRIMVDKNIAIIMLVIFGATSNALLQLSIARKNKTPFDWIDMVIALVISAFAGTIFGIGAAYFMNDSHVIHAVAGIGAFLGLKGMNHVSDTILVVLSNKVKK